MRVCSLSTFAGFILVAIMTMSSVGCHALSGASRVREDTKLPGNWILQNDKVQVVVDAARGRIMHYGFLDGRNVLWVSAEAEKPEYAMGGWINWGGDKIWPWPQNLFGWPPPEVGYEVKPNEKGDGLVMTSAVVPLISARIVRTVELADDSSSLVVTSWLEPTGTEFGKPMGTWSITQVPPPKEIYVRIPLAGDRNRYLARSAKGDNFQTKQAGNRVVKLTSPSGVGKTFMDADVIAAVYDDVVLLQRQVAVHKEGVWASDERAQIYAHPLNAPNVPPGKSYHELEWTAPVLPPNQVAKAPLRVIYKLVKITEQTTPEQIAAMVETLP